MGDEVDKRKYVVVAWLLFLTVAVAYLLFYSGNSFECYKWNYETEAELNELCIGELRTFHLTFTDRPDILPRGYYAECHVNGSLGFRYSCSNFMVIRV